MKISGIRKITVQIKKYILKENWTICRFCKKLGHFTFFFSKFFICSVLYLGRRAERIRGVKPSGFCAFFKKCAKPRSKERGIFKKK